MDSVTISPEMWTKNIVISTNFLLLSFIKRKNAITDHLLFARHSLLGKSRTFLELIKLGVRLAY